MSAITRQILEKDSGVCILVVRGNPNTLTLIAPKGSLALDVTNAALYVSNDSATSDWLVATLT